MRQRGKRPPSGTAALAAEPAQADRFSKARSARSASMLEDYTELIADLIAANGEARTTDIARRLGVAHPTASKTIARLKREGLARAQPYRGIFLTESGAAMAKSARQRHRLVVDLLIAVGAPREAAEADPREAAEAVPSRLRLSTPSQSRGRSESPRPLWRKPPHPRVHDPHRGLAVMDRRRRPRRPRGKAGRHRRRRACSRP
jgi:DtxR family transcriptional regulator, manganese transport regulator